ncbi:YceI family protein [Kiritimatiellota bacterium B12222]|nr:YceI family protein [Kiritimatiellota bacterium B12222]
MKTILALSCLLFSTLLTAENLTATAHIQFDGTSTLHDFTGKAEAEAPARWIPRAQGATLNIPEIIVDVTTLSTDHKKRDKNMLKMLDPVTYPTIIGKIEAWQLSSQKASEQIFTLRIQETTLELPVTVGAYTETPEGISIPCQFTLSLKAFDLKRPSVLGLIKVGDEVTLNIEALLRKP